MTGVLTRYIAGLLLLRLAAVLAGLAGLLILLDFLADGDQVLATGEGTVRPVLRYVGLRLPDILSQLIPIAGLLAGLLAFAELARYRELAAVFSAGLSRSRLMLATLPVALAIAALQFLVEDQAVPFAAAELRQWGIGEYEQRDPEPFAWIHLDRDIVRYRRPAAGDDASRLAQVTIHRRDPAGALIEAIAADRAVYEPGGWVLYDVRRSAGQRQTTQHLDRLAWPRGPDPSLLADANTPPGTRSLSNLAAVVAQAGLGDYPLYVYRLALNERIMRPVMTVLLVLLGAALARPHPRGASIGIFIATGTALGLLGWTAAAFLASVGELGLLPPALAVWAPTVLVALLAAFAVLNDGPRLIRKRWWAPPAAVARAAPLRDDGRR